MNKETHRSFRTRWTFCFFATIQLCSFSVAENFPFLENLNLPRNRGGDQSKAAWEVIDRLIPDKAVYFKTYIVPNPGYDSFSIVKKEGSIEISGPNGVSIVWGFNYYLKNYCNSHVGWQVKQINIPDELPDVNVTVRAKDKFRYYQNVCTASYSFVWWDVKNWREHIDWMAMNGINVALAPHGQEAIWLRVYKKLNLTDAEISEHFTGPAFLSWQRMGNIRGWGGPLSNDWHVHSVNIEKFIINAMNELGMIPALPAFAGFVPNGLKRIYPEAKMNPTEQWNRFQSKFCCPLFLEPTDPLFKKIGNMFLSQMISEFGTSHLYYSDPFNEIKPTSSDKEFLKNVGMAIYQSMTDVDSQAIWLLQNWMFVHDSLYWTSERAKAFLTSVPSGRMLILDLQSEQWPQYDKHEMYYGQPFIWCMLLNFGGTLGMVGDSESINKEVYRARSIQNSTMVGIGLTPEGINQNYVMYDLLLESGLNSESNNLTEWTAKYALRRYGKSNEIINKTWDILINSIYNFRGLNKIRGKYVITRRPSLNIKPWAWYSENNLKEAYKLMLSVQDDFLTSDGYRHDLVDITRQFLQYKADQLYLNIIYCYSNKDLKKLKTYSDVFLNLFEDLDRILSSSADFLLGNWLESAKKLAQTKEDLIQFEFNARNQITLWGPNGEIFDYANKQWAGLVSDYYGARWKVFIDGLQNSLAENKKINMKIIQKEMFDNVESAFTLSTKKYSTQAQGDSIVISQKIFDKWISSSYLDIPLKPIFKNNLKQTYSRPRREFHEIDEDTDYDEPVPHVILVH